MSLLRRDELRFDALPLLRDCLRALFFTPPRDDDDWAPRPRFDCAPREEERDELDAPRDDERDWELDFVLLPEVLSEEVLEELAVLR